MRCFSTPAVPSCVLLLALTTGCASTRPSAEGAASDGNVQESSESIEVILQRKAPGLLITRTNDGGISVRLRGTTTYTGADVTPLYMLNGSPIRPGPGGALTGIDPYQIESIRLVRSAEAGIYGIDGANGVVVITTRKPDSSER